MNEWYLRILCRIIQNSENIYVFFDCSRFFILLFDLRFSVSWQSVRIFLTLVTANRSIFFRKVISVSTLNWFGAQCWTLSHHFTFQSGGSWERSSATNKTQYFIITREIKMQRANIVLVAVWVHIQRMSFRWNGNILHSTWHVWSQLEPPINTTCSRTFVGHACRMDKQGRVQSRVQCIYVISTKMVNTNSCEQNKMNCLNFALQLFCSLSLSVSALELTRKRNQCHHWQHTVINFENNNSDEKKNHVIFIRNSFQLIARHRSTICLNSQFQFYSTVPFCVCCCVNGGRTTLSCIITRWGDTMYDAVGHRLSKQHIVGWNININKQNMFERNECNSRSNGAYKERKMTRKKKQHKLTFWWSLSIMDVSGQQRVSYSNVIYIVVWMYVCALVAGVWCVAIYEPIGIVFECNEHCNCAAWHETFQLKMNIKYQVCHFNLTSIAAENARSAQCSLPVLYRVFTHFVGNHFSAIPLLNNMVK